MFKEWDGGPLYHKLEYGRQMIVEGHCFFVVETTKSAKNIWEPVIETFIILGFLMADTSLKQPKIYTFCKICHIFTLYSAKITFTCLILSCESHFHL